MTDPMCHRSPKLLLSLNEIMEWGMLATTRGQCLIEWRLMGHTVVLLCQAVGGGREHDCSTWDAIYENEDNEAANAWNAPSQAKSSNNRNVATALAQTANALEPGAEIVLRKKFKGIVKVVQVSSRLEKRSQLNAELLEGIGRGEVGDHAYADSKRALMLWTSTRAQSLAFKGGLYCHCSTPGMVDTELGRLAVYDLAAPAICVQELVAANAYSVSPWLWPLTKPLRMLLLRSPAEGALAAVAGGLLPQATTRFGRYMDGEVQLEDLVLSRMGEKALATDLVKWASKATALEQRADGYDR
eukprot:s5111_g8.t2